MQIDKELISRLEQLTRLELSEEERENIRQDLNGILGMVEKLQELDLDQVEPLVYVSEEINRWREDEVRAQVSQEEALRNAPQSNGSFFLVPKVIDL